MTQDGKVQCEERRDASERAERVRPHPVTLARESIAAGVGTLLDEIQTAERRAEAAERERTALRAQVEQLQDVQMRYDDAHSYLDSVGVPRDVANMTGVPLSVRGRMEAAHLHQEQAHQPLRDLIAKWRGADADDAVSRGYVETGNTFQVCANELEAALKDSGGTR